MFNRLKSFLFGPVAKSPQNLLEDEVLFLRSQVASLQETLKNLTEKPKSIASNPEAMRPKKFDETTGQFRPMTDAEINGVQQGFRELGIA